jgi:hypothetical protein
MVTIPNVDLSTVGALAIPLIIAIVQALKMVGLKTKFAPLVSLAVGILLAFIMDHGASLTIGESVLHGILYGLGASGLYSGTKATEIFANEKASEPEIK